MTEPTILPPAICRPCHLGACDDCDGTAWSEPTNFPTQCDCWADNHKGDL